MPSDSRPALSVVMPVYNEEGSIEAVLAEWTAALQQTGADYELRVYDDGSRDRTAAILQRASAADPRIISSTHGNRGHGPTLMRGYQEARGEWVFQTDSDGEMPASAFGTLWRLRESHDVVLGSRAGRESPAHRRLMSRGSRVITALLFGNRVADVNTPYRLMRGSWLREQLAVIPPDAAVPNILLSGLVTRTRARLAEVPVQHVNRQTGTTSLNLRRIVRLSLRAIADSVRVAAARSR
jgi:dolichol-phosphate mannosyltransferase